MSNFKKLMMTAAGGAGLNVEDVFSTYLYTGTGSAQTITNGIDLAGEGGLVWTKRRNGGSGTWSDHWLNDSERGDDKGLRANLTNAQFGGDSLNFSSSGYTAPNWVIFTENGTNYASWTFRKAPKFFDVVTYTGDGNSTKVLSHNLGTTVGSVIIKCTNDSAQNWQVFHRAMSGTPNYSIMNLNTTASVTTVGVQLWDQSSTTFTVYANTGQNVSGKTYVAYLFAHNDGDGDFGPTGDQDIIKCGSFTVNSSGWSVDLGFEPQWVMIKKSSGTSDWGIVDNMRSWDTLSGTGDNASQLRANLSNAENRETYPRITATGFNHEGAAGWLTSGQTYIYIAIRRGPMAVPTAGTDVFDVSIGSSNGNVITTGFPVDTQILNFILGDTNNSTVIDRLRGFSSTSTESGKRLVTSQTADENSVAVSEKWTNTGFTEVGAYGSIYACYWNWRRAPNFFDAVCYSHK
jgi:hypothetical protein